MMGRLPGAHAEITAMDLAAKVGLTPAEIAVSNVICPACQAAIVSSGGVISEDLLGAIWP
jgi:tRNA(Arg) A34 adenosine deaminase TadA